MTGQHTPFSDSSMEDAFQLGRLDGQTDFLIALKAWIDTWFTVVQAGNEKLKGGRAYECDGLNCPPRAHDHKVMIPAVFCAHANEVPTRCPCEPNCYCKSHTCKKRNRAQSVENEYDIQRREL